jgi:hypothetical protein
MSEQQSVADLGNAMEHMLDRLSGTNAEGALGEARKLAEALCEAREFGPLSRLAEAISRIAPKDPTNRRLYAQALIETGKATAAIDMLNTLMRRLPVGHPESAEVSGLLGRAYKQIFFDARDRSGAPARQALKEAIAAYSKPFEENSAHTWHGVNLMALLSNSRRLGIRAAPSLNLPEMAAQLVKSIEAIPEQDRKPWHLLTLAEAHLGIDDWAGFERTVRACVINPDAKAFAMASLLRQLTEIWDLQASERGRNVVNILRARLLTLPGGELRLEPNDVRQLQRQAAPSDGKLEAILGQHGARTFSWWKTGLMRARSVASIRPRLGSRLGTGFLVRASDLGLDAGEELVVLTNFHVVNEKGVSPGIRAEEAEITFEAADSEATYGVEKLLWSSPPEQCDASILRLSKTVTNIDPLPVAKTLPVLGESAQVYVVGYPGGRDLSFSFQDNELLDHEGPPGGTPQIPGVSRLHYTAPTEGGSSGSPVFNASLWQVIALHHKGGKVGMPRLNGVTGTYAANEGISIQSIVAFSKS